MHLTNSLEEMIRGLSMQKKIIASVMAFIMLATGICVFTATDDSDASVGINTVNVYYQTFDQSNQLDWNCSSVEKFNLYEALVAVTSSIYTLDDDSDWTVTSATAGTYPSETYGTVSGVAYNNTDYTSTFSIKVCNAGDNTWTDVTDYPLGWFRPFTDYNSIVSMVQLNPGDNVGSGYANIAISLTGADPSANIVANNPLKTLTNPQGNSAFLYQFDIVDAFGLSFDDTQYAKKVAGGSLVAITDDDWEDGFTIYGYGSDAYLALYDATGSSVTEELKGQTVTWDDHEGAYLTQYSWMDSLFGVKTKYGPGAPSWSYAYWCTYKCDTGGNVFTPFNLGYHTLVDGYFTDLVYDFMSQQWVPYSSTGNHFLIQYEVY
jgi:hypothetical protein